MTVLEVLSYCDVDGVCCADFEAGRLLVDDNVLLDAGLFFVLEFFSFWFDSSYSGFDSDIAGSLPLASYSSVLPLRAFFSSSL